MAESIDSIRYIESSALLAAVLERDASAIAAVRGAGRRFPVEPVRTLDAVHLATLELLGEPPSLVTVVTRDARVRENAAALGYAVE